MGARAQQHNQMKSMFLLDLINDLSDKEPSDPEDPEWANGANLEDWVSARDQLSDQLWAWAVRLKC